MKLDFNFFIKILFPALLVRLILMPIGFSGDLIHVNYFPYFLSQNVWDIYGYFGDHYIMKGGFSYYQPLVYYVIGFFQILLKPLNPGIDAFMAHTHELMYFHTRMPGVDYLSDFFGL